MSNPYDGNLLWSKAPELVLGPIMFLTSMGATFVPSKDDWRIVVISIALISLIVLLFFFRSPPIDKSGYPGLHISDLVSPADGIVMQVDEIDTTNLHDNYDNFVDINNNTYATLNTGTKGKRIVIYLGMTHLHFQCAPANATMHKITHKDGEFYPASMLKKSQYNERTIMEMFVPIAPGRTGNLFIVLIAGIIARRIQVFEPYRREDSQMMRGDKISLIKLSSRVDLIIPDNYDVKVKQGDRVIVGQTLVAKAPVYHADAPPPHN